MFGKKSSAEMVMSGTGQFAVSQAWLEASQQDAETSAGVTGAAACHSSSQGSYA